MFVYTTLFFIEHIYSSFMHIKYCRGSYRLLELKFTVMLGFNIGLFVLLILPYIAQAWFPDDQKSHWSNLLHTAFVVAAPLINTECFLLVTTYKGSGIIVNDTSKEYNDDIRGIQWSRKRFWDILRKILRDGNSVLLGILSIIIIVTIVTIVLYTKGMITVASLLIVLGIFVLRWYYFYILFRDYP